MNQDIVRVVRIMEYIGPRDAVEKSLANSNVPANGEQIFRNMQGVSKLTIKSATLGSFPEILERAKNDEFTD